MANLDYQIRREHLLNALEENSIVLISGAKARVRNSDCHFNFRQDSDFFYLTGFEEPNAFLVLIKRATEKKFILFTRGKNFNEELWEGKRAGLEGAVLEYGADDAFNFSELSEKLPDFLANIKNIYYRLSSDLPVSQSLPSWLNSLHKKVRTGISIPSIFHDLTPLLSEMRLIKSESELAIMRRVCAVSAQAHKKAMISVSHCDYEYQLEAEINYELMRQGVQRVAYNSIVAAGKNACILHYTQNNAQIQTDDLILIDAGGELQNYAADITRTFPKNGTFNPEQKQIYQIVLEAQKEGISLICEGVIWTKIQEVMVEIISKGLLSLGLLSGTLKDVIDNKSYQKFYMHNSGHWLGLDVHDQGAYKEKGEWRALKKGMVLTVEPGIYIADHHEDIDPKWHNIGVRIEDDILVTENGFENLTAAVPKEISEIEALINNAM